MGRGPDQGRRGAGRGRAAGWHSQELWHLALPFSPREEGRACGAAKPAPW